MIETLKRERRLHERFTATCEIEFASNGQTYKGISGNFSLSGLFIKTGILFAPDTIIAMVVHLPDGSTSKLTGKILRALKMPKGGFMTTPAMALEDVIGIEIIKKDSHYLKFLRSFVTSR